MAVKDCTKLDRNIRYKTELNMVGFRSRIHSYRAKWRERVDRMPDYHVNRENNI